MKKPGKKTQLAVVYPSLHTLLGEDSSQLAVVYPSLQTPHTLLGEDSSLRRSGVRSPDRFGE